MDDAGVLVAVLAAIVIALAMLSLAALKGWADWLDYRRAELNGGGRPPSPAAARRELAELKDRVRRLEAIAEGGEE
jgi:hypothetical protein